MGYAKYGVRGFEKKKKNYINSYPAPGFFLHPWYDVYVFLSHPESSNLRDKKIIKKKKENPCAVRYSRDRYPS